MSTDTNQPVITVATASDIVAAAVNNTNADVSSLSGGTDPTSVKDATLEHVVLCKKGETVLVSNKEKDGESTVKMFKLGEDRNRR